MGPGAKQATIARMIDNGMKSSNARRYDLNQARTQQCMQRNGANIELDFDGACADSRSASLRALNNIFKNYAFSCIQ